jgi:hypothetical protein
VKERLDSGMVEAIPLSLDPVLMKKVLIEKIELLSIHAELSNNS